MCSLGRRRLLEKQKQDRSKGKDICIDRRSRSSQVGCFSVSAFHLFFLFTDSRAAAGSSAAAAAGSSQPQPTAQAAQ